MDFLDLVSLGAMALLGGVAKLAHSLLTTTNFKVLTAIATIVVGIFSGFMLALFMETMGMTGKGLLLAAGMGGWLGTEALQYIQKRLQEK